MPRSILSAVILALMLCGGALAAEPSKIWIDVPFVPQQKDGCGAAVVAMVMQYWHGREPASATADYEQVERTLYAPDAHGVYASAMQRYFEQNGYRAFAFTGEWTDLAQHLSKGRPLVVALKPGSGLPMHYVVVVGIDAANQLVLVNDPAERKLLEEDDARFEKEWKAAGHWTLLAVPGTAPRK